LTNWCWSTWWMLYCIIRWKWSRWFWSRKSFWYWWCGGTFIHLTTGQFVAALVRAWDLIVDSDFL
jgi:hypothetical protein